MTMKTSHGGKTSHQPDAGWGGSAGNSRVTVEKMRNGG